MTKKELMIKAHKMTKEIKAQYPTVDYKFQLGLCLAYLQEGGNEMISYKTEKGTSVEVNIERKEITDLTVNGIELLKNTTGGMDCYLTKGFIVINSSNLYKKLGAKSQIKIVMNEELENIYNEESAKVIVGREKRTKSFVENTKIAFDQYNYTFEKHMSNKNNL
jgi:hypothetical protein